MSERFIKEIVDIEFKHSESNEAHVNKQNLYVTNGVSSNLNP